MKITYIHHSAFLVETESAYLLFDYFQGKLPEFSEEKPLYVFASHRHPDHFSKVIFELEEKHPKIHYILAFDIWSKRVPESCKGKTEFLNPGQILDDGTLKVEGFKSTDRVLVQCGWPGDLPCRRFKPLVLGWGRSAVEQEHDESVPGRDREDARADGGHRVPAAGSATWRVFLPGNR